MQVQGRATPNGDTGARPSDDQDDQLGRSAADGDPAVRAAADVQRLLADAAGLQQIVDLAEEVAPDRNLRHGPQDERSVG